MSDAKLILVRLVGNDDALSEPIKVYDRLGKKLPKRFTLRLDECVNRNGDEQLRLGNYDLGLVGSHGVEFLTEKLTGYNRVIGDDTFVVAEKFSESTASVKDAMAVTAS